MRLDFSNCQSASMPHGVASCPPCLQGPVTFRHAVFVPPGYASLLFAHLYEDSSCPLRTTLFAGFRSFLLSAFDLEGADLWHAEDDVMAGDARGAGAGAGAAAAAADGAAARHNAGAPVRIRLISRRPGQGKNRMARQIANEAELLAALNAVASDAGSNVLASVSLVDFAPMSGGLDASMPVAWLILPTDAGSFSVRLQWTSNWRLCSTPISW